MSQERLERKTILLIEDDVSIGPILLDLLRDEIPCNVVLASTPDEALKVLEDITPVLFILTYRLPGMNGIQLLDRLHAQPGLEEVPALMLSATLPRKELNERGIIGIEKPFDISIVLERVKEAIHEQ